MVEERTRRVQEARSGCVIEWRKGRRVVAWLRRRTARAASSSTSTFLSGDEVLDLGTAVALLSPFSHGRVPARRS
jgi:hypothetical protein